LAPVPNGAPATVARAITAGSHAAFMSGLHVALIVAAVISLLGAFLAPFIRRGATAESAVEPAEVARAPQVTDVPPARPVTPAVSESRVVRGFIRQSSGAPVAQAAITLIDPNGRQAGRLVTDANGGYQLSAPTPGHYVLIARASAHQPQALGVEMNGAPVDVDIVLTGSSGLIGAVRTTAGGPIAQATVTVTDARGEVVASSTTDADGKYLFDELLSGDYTLVASAQRFRPAALPVDVASSGNTELNVELAGGGSLRGTTVAGPGPVADAQVSLIDSAGNVVAMTRSDESGQYAFHDVTSDNYTVIATSYPPVSSTVRIGSGDRQQHDIQLQYPRP
jgi:uncharacterized protein YfaS (alpha-2-macroglobulin family)